MDLPESETSKPACGPEAGRRPALARQGFRITCVAETRRNQGVFGPLVAAHRNITVYFVPFLQASERRAAASAERAPPDSTPDLHQPLNLGRGSWVKPEGASTSPVRTGASA